MTPTFAGGDNLFRILEPHEKAGRVAVVGLQVGAHGIHQRLQGGEVFALQAAPRQFSEEICQSVHPGIGSGRKVKVPVEVSGQPGVYGGGFVGGVVVQKHVQRGRGRGLYSQGVQEIRELLLAVFRLGLGGGLSRLQGQAGLGALQGLDLRLSSTDSARACARRSRYRPITSRALRAKWGSAENLNWRQRCGASPCRRQMRRRAEWPRPTSCSRSRLVQWEAPSVEKGIPDNGAVK